MCFFLISSAVGEFWFYVLWFKKFKNLTRAPHIFFFRGWWDIFHAGFKIYITVINGVMLSLPPLPRENEISFLIASVSCWDRPPSSPPLHPLFPSLWARYDAVIVYKGYKLRAIIFCCLETGVYSRTREIGLREVLRYGGKLFTAGVTWYMAQGLKKGLGYCIFNSSETSDTFPRFLNYESILYK